jgi:hypothetical protein
MVTLSLVKSLESLCVHDASSNMIRQVVACSTRQGIALCTVSVSDAWLNFLVAKIHRFAAVERSSMRSQCGQRRRSAEAKLRCSEVLALFFPGSSENSDLHPQYSGTPPREHALKLTKRTDVVFSRPVVVTDTTTWRPRYAPSLHEEKAPPESNQESCTAVDLCPTLVLDITTAKSSAGTGKGRDQGKCCNSRQEKMRNRCELDRRKTPRFDLRPPML